MHQFLGEWEDALPLAEERVELARATGDPLELAKALSQLSAPNTALGWHSRKLAHAESSYLEPSVSRSSGHVCLDRARPMRAGAACERAVVAEKHQGERVDAGPLVCEECRRVWSDPTARWRVYLTADDPPVAVAYCPACAEREFGEEVGPAT